MAYATPEQLAARFDARVIAENTVDNDRTEISTDLSSNLVVLEALEDASAQIRSAALVANNYTEDELSTLAESQDAFLVRLCCTLAVGYILNRRSMGKEPLPPTIEQAEQWLAMLRLGERIFNVADNSAAGTMRSSVLTSSQRTDLSLVADNYRFFPVRRQLG